MRKRRVGVTARLRRIDGNPEMGSPQIVSEMAAPPESRTPMGTAAVAAIRVRMEAWRQRRGSQLTGDYFNSNGNEAPRASDGAPGGAHEALPQTPPGGRPPETPAPFPSGSRLRNVGNLSRVRKPRTNRAPLTDSLRSEDLTEMRERGLLVKWGSLPRLPLVGMQRQIRLRGTARCARMRRCLILRRGQAPWDPRRFP